MHMVVVLVILEMIAFALVMGLLFIVTNYMEQYNADKDQILKSNAIFIALFLGGKCFLSYSCIL